MDRALEDLVCLAGLFVILSLLFSLFLVWIIDTIKNWF